MTKGDKMQGENMSNEELAEQAIPNTGMLATFRLGIVMAVKEALDAKDVEATLLINKLAVPNLLADELQSRNLSLEKQVKEMKAALEPFARVLAEQGAGRITFKEGELGRPLTLQDFVNAQSALRNTEELG